MSSLITRRRILGLGATAAATLVFPRVLQDRKILPQTALLPAAPVFPDTPVLPVAPAEPAAPAIRQAGLLARELKFHNTHTGENLVAAYWADGEYVPGALAEVRRVMRDHRSGDEHDIDVRLLDLLHKLREKLDTTETIDIISGYRSPKTNKTMAEHSNGVAKRSLHMLGEAIDIRIQGRDLDRVHKAAMAMKSGGVGFYPASDFVHMDVGRVRSWGQAAA